MRKWLPYAPSDRADVWEDVFDMFPNVSGDYYPTSLYAVVVAAGPATPGDTLRAWCALRPDAASLAVGYVGTTTKLYVVTGAGAFTDRSVGGGYTSTAADWSFAQYGEITLATNRVDNLQSRDCNVGGNFAAVAGSPPKSRLIVAQADQILLFDLNDGAEKADAFASCAPGDYTDWSGAGATTATYIRHRPGKIVTAVAFRDYVLVFKQNSVYKLTYTGSTFKWRVELIAIGIGCVSKHDVVNCGEFVVFKGKGGAYRYDGSSFRPIGNYMGQTLSAGVQGSLGSWYSDITRNVLFLEADAAIYAYNTISDRWGRGSVTNTAGNLLIGQKPMTGEPAARRTFLTEADTDLDLSMMFNLSSATLAVMKSTSLWGNGSASTKAHLVGSIEGAGGRAVTLFDGLDIDFVLAYSGAATIPSATSLTLDVFTGESKDVSSLKISSATPVLADKISQTTQRRFDFQTSAVYAKFKIKIPASAGYCEIRNYTPRMKANGVL